ncbi:MAG: histidine kinase [Candidatus Cloacimonetes bacterium]|nr:histidine kinase [Candidatus Cloacimonadota bacterium]
MKIRTEYLIFIIIIHLIFIALSLQLLNRPLFFLAAEILILISIFFSILIYKHVIDPVNVISAAVESIRERDFSTKLVKIGHYEMDRLIEVYNLMIEQLRLERLKQQEKHYFMQKLISASPTAIILLDLEERIITLNKTAEKFLDVSLPQVEQERLYDIPGRIFLELGRLRSGEARIIRISGVETYKCQRASFLDRGFNHHFIIMEKLTDEMIKTEKKAYGSVIRMMSHEMNNSIGAVNSILESSLSYVRHLPAAERDSFLNGINTAIARNSQLNRFMNNFAEVVRIPDPRNRLENLHDLIKNIAVLMSGEFQKRDIIWEEDLVSGSFLVNIDIQQIEQVLVNVIKNACESIENGGRIEIITRREPVKILIVRDNGKGVPEEIRDRLFVPFFSTKRNGQGIGLTLTREILLKHGCKFSLDTLAQGKTEFKIEFSEQVI